jgi:hypothetical protein
MTTDTDTTSASSTNRPERSFTVHHQSVFVTVDGEGDAETDTGTKTVDEHGLLALDDEPFETTLFHHGVNVDTRERTSRIEIGGSDEFIDDRPLSVICSRNGAKTTLDDAPGSQGTLFADTAVDQRTLDGEQASVRFMFEADHRRQHVHARESEDDVSRPATSR